MFHTFVSLLCSALAYSALASNSYVGNDLASATASCDNHIMTADTFVKGSWDKAQYFLYSYVQQDDSTTLIGTHTKSMTGIEHDHWCLSAGYYILYSDGADTDSFTVKVCDQAVVSSGSFVMFSVGQDGLCNVVMHEEETQTELSHREMAADALSMSAEYSSAEPTMEPTMMEDTPSPTIAPTTADENPANISSEDEDDDDELSGGIIAAIVICSIVGVALIGYGVFAYSTAQQEAVERDFQSNILPKFSGSNAGAGAEKAHEVL